MPRYIIKKVSPTPTKGEIAVLFVDAPSAAEAVAKAPRPGAWKLHRRVDEDEQRATRAGVVLAPRFSVPGRSGRNF